MPGLDFGAALTLLRAGEKMRRDAWPEGGWIQLRAPATGAWKPEPFIVAHRLLGTNRGCLTWRVGHVDLLAHDWHTVGESKSGPRPRKKPAPRPEETVAAAPPPQTDEPAR